MTCKLFQKYELGQIESDIFEDHLASCETCTQKKLEDDQLLNLAQSLKQPFAKSDFWPEIEEALRQEKEQSKNIIKLPQLISNYKNIILRIAAIFVIGFGLGFYFLSLEDVPEKGIIKSAALIKVEEREKEYLDAIAELEEVATEHMGSFDLNLMLLYRDKLETIDLQIADCKDALELNPANAHIRKYLFAALEDKKETLREILNSKPINADEEV